MTVVSVGPGVVSFPRLPTNDLAYWGYAIPICIGFLVGPWLDLQQWQRAIQMHRERISIAAAYWAGSTPVFHAPAVSRLPNALGSQLGCRLLFAHGIANYVYGHELLLRLFFEQIFAVDLRRLCRLAGHLHLIHPRQRLHRLALVPPDPCLGEQEPDFLADSRKPDRLPNPRIHLRGPVCLVRLGGQAGTRVLHDLLRDVLCRLLGACDHPMLHEHPGKRDSTGEDVLHRLPGGRHIRVRILSPLPILQILGSLLPLALVIWLIFKPGSSQEFIGDSRALSPVSEIPMHPEEENAPESFAATQKEAIRQRAEARARELGVPSAPADENGEHSARGHDLSGHFEGKWFVHSFIATYADTNSVGNVYFGMYAMWVGKTRELFFNKVLPRFNIKETPFYILTRSLSTSSSGKPVSSSGSPSGFGFPTGTESLSPSNTKLTTQRTSCLEKASRHFYSFLRRITE